MMLDSEADADELAQYRLVIAALMGISGTTQLTLAAALELERGIVLTGAYVAVTCDATGCMPASVPGRTLPEAFTVFDESAKALNEPYAGDGDFDGDGTSNAVEYQNVIDAGGGLAEFIDAATDPASVGTPPEPKGCGAAPGGVKRNLAGDTTLMLLAAALLLVAGRRERRLEKEQPSA